MTPRLAPICAAFIAGACFSHAATAVTLYNPVANTLPGAQGWLTSTSGGTVSPTVSGGTYKVDTTADAAISSGSARLGLALDTAAGFTLTFDLQVLAESHQTPDRSGFSVIVVGSTPQQEIEIAFWRDRVWAYAYDGVNFTHGVEKLFDTSTAMQSYSLTVQNQQYALSAGGTSLISGSLANYTPFGGIYAVGGSLFFGDDTSRAASSIALGTVALSPVPEPATVGLFLLGGALLAFRKRRAKG